MNCVCFEHLVILMGKDDIERVQGSFTRMFIAQAGFHKMNYSHLLSFLSFRTLECGREKLIFVLFTKLFMVKFSLIRKRFSAFFLLYTLVPEKHIIWSLKFLPKFLYGILCFSKTVSCLSPGAFWCFFFQLSDSLTIVSSYLALTDYFSIVWKIITHPRSH